MLLLAGLGLAYLVVARPEVSTPTVGETIQYNGLLLSSGWLLSLPWAVVFVVLLARSRRGISAREYLGVRAADWRLWVLWFAVAATFVAGWEVLTVRLGRSSVSEWTVEAYRTAQFVPLLWIVLVLVAPLIEELICRGFMYRGIAASPLGHTGAVVVTTLLFVLWHAGQYDLIQLQGVLGIGVVKGVRTVSLSTLGRILFGWLGTPAISFALAAGLYQVMGL